MQSKSKPCLWCLKPLGELSPGARHAKYHRQCFWPATLFKINLRRSREKAS